MATRANPPINAEFVLQICLGVFFLALGIMGVTEFNSKVSGVLRFFGKNDTLNMIIAIVEIAMGAVLLLAIVVRLPGGLGKVLGIVLAVLWAILMVMTYVVNKPFEPTFIEWLVGLSRDASILAALWIVACRFSA